MGYTFRDKALLIEALKHRSFLYDTPEDGGPLAELGHSSANGLPANERLEFLGDAVLGLATTAFLFHRYPDEPEGELTKRKSVLVSKSVLAQRALAMGLDRYLLLSDPEEIAGGRGRRSILGDGFEALLGALYLDGGHEPVSRFLDRHLFRYVEELTRDTSFANYKSLLLEYIQARGRPPPEYHVSGQSGPDHSKTFAVSVSVDGKALGAGEGKSKKDAQQSAAKQAYEGLRGESTHQEQ